MWPAIGSLVGGLLSGGASLIGGQQSNAATAAQTQMQDAFNASMMLGSEQYNTQAAATANEYSRNAMSEAENFNASQAQSQMNFQDTELGKAMTFNSGQAQKAMDFSAQQAQIQRDYETQMSNTAYARAVAGMKAAGLNPILSAGTGGASTPQVSAPQGVSASVGVPGGAAGSVGAPSGAQASVGMLGGGAQRMADVVSPAVNNALQGSKLFYDLQQANAGVDQTKATTRLTNQNVDVANSQADINNQTVSNLRATYDNIMAQKNLIDQQASDAAASARLKAAQVDQTNRSTQTMGGDISGFGFRVNPFAWWPPSGTSFSPGNPGTVVAPTTKGPNSDSVWGENGNSVNDPGSSHSWVVNPDGSKGVQLW